MNNQHIYHPIAKALIEMGYNPDVIPLALAGSGDKSLEEVLDILLVLPKDKIESRMLIRDQEGEAMRIQKANILRDTTTLKTNKNNDAEDEEIMAINIKPQKEVPILTSDSRERLRLYFKIMVENLQAIRSQNANDFISRMIECLSEIKESFDKLGLTPKEFFATLHDPRLTAKVRNKAFEIIRKVLTMRSEYKIRLNRLDQLLLATFQMNLITAKQRDSIIECYRDLYKRIEHPLNHHFIETLTKTFQSQNDGGDGPSIRDLQLVDQRDFAGQNMIQSAHGAHEEAKSNDNVDVHCIICMKDLKKIVFLPCCHFLTCPGCSKKVSKCPMCNREIAQYQKIFWS